MTSIITQNADPGALLTEVDPDAGWGDQPVDSTYYACCHAIGQHGQDCDTVTARKRHVGRFTLSATAAQRDGGGIIEPAKLWIDGPECGLTAEQARVMAAALLEMATEVDGFTEGTSG